MKQFRIYCSRLNCMLMCFFTISSVLLFYKEYKLRRTYSLTHTARESPAWIKEAKIMAKMDEGILRCAAEDIGCFAMVPSPTVVDKNFGREHCLNFCFKRSNQYAGLGAEGKCYCTNSMKSFTNVARRCDIACSMERSSYCKSSLSVRMYRKTQGCYEGPGNSSISNHVVGCVKLSEIPTKELTVWRMKFGMTVEQCILKCEEAGFILAIPAIKYQTCICSHMLNTFKTAENVRKMTLACDEEKKPEETEESFLIYSTHVEECPPKRFLFNRQGPFTILTSFWGSGNTWLRHLIEVATGIYTGSVYRDNFLYDGGMLGEMLHHLSARTVIIKDHLLIDPKKVSKRYTSAVLLLRNPYDATLAEYARSHSHNNHIAIIDPKIYMSEAFKNSAGIMAQKWLYHVKTVFQTIPSVMIVYYEDLVKNPIVELRRIINYLPSKIVPRDEKLEQRLMCMILDLKGNFKRGSKGITSNPYTDELKTIYDQTINTLDKFLKERNMTGLPFSYFQPWQL
uniref:WSC domain-containing protein 1-like isoform X2 n=1 Tax=Styela clava TaxID=7725 RepID=UPI00193A8BC1|nr:WSC domain-containing protein 1-like isoform X2 [Styela clava]